MKLTLHNFHEYQTYALNHVLPLKGSALFMDMGLGKTVVALTAVNVWMYEELEIVKTLIVAPKRVAEHTWTTEAAKWEHLKHLKIAKVLGNEKQRKEALRQKADVYVINRENVPWLVSLFGSAFPFDCVIVDELSSFKSPKAQRFKMLRAVLPRIQRIVGLTATPASNTLIDLWSQIYLLDKGERLGKTLTEYRNQYFKEGRRNGHVVYDYKLKGDPQAIYDKIGDICISMKARDYLKMPSCIDRTVDVNLSDKDMKAYKDFEKEAVLALSESDEITVAHAAALTNKLLQFANGAVYREDKSWQEVHKAKIDALVEDVEAAQGEPYLIFYQYKHDLERLMLALKSYSPVKLESDKDITAFSKGEIQVMLAHAASAGHGIDGLQMSCNLIGWFGVPWSLEQYLQAVGRIDRQGQQRRVTNTRFLVKGTIDEDVLKALESKTTGQEALLEAVKARIKKYKNL